MKTYKHRLELIKDINFINETLTGINDVRRNYLINMLFENWLMLSPDSPLYNEADINLVKIIKGEGISNQWKGEHIIFHDI